MRFSPGSTPPRRFRGAKLPGWRERRRLAGRRYDQCLRTIIGLVTLVEALRPIREGVHRLPDLPLVRLVQNGGDDLLHPHPHLPAHALLFLRGATAPQVGVLISVTAGHVEQGVAHPLDPLRAQDLDEPRHARPLDLL